MIGNLYMHLKDLLNEIEAGFFTVPEIQRRFIWRNPQIRELLSSIYKQYPIGSIVYWDIPNEILRDESLRELFRPLADDLPLENARYTVIDGQQRLTSLFLLKRGEISINGRRRKIMLYFNPIEEKFELGTRDLQRDPNWFNVSEIVSCENIYKLLDDRAQKLQENSIKKNPIIIQNLAKFRDNFNTYDIPMVLARLSYTDDFLSTFEKISNIFINLNSTGTRIKLPDLALALLTARTRRDIGDSFRKKFESILQKLEDQDFLIEEPILIRLYLAIATGTTRFTEAKKELERNSGKEIDNFLEETSKTIEGTIKFLKEMGLSSSKFFQSRYLLVPIAYQLYKDVISVGKIVSERTKNDLIKWVILASFEKRYTGRLETDLLTDIKQIENGNGVKGLIENLKMKDLTLSQFECDYDECHLTLLLLLYNKLKTEDWNLKERPNIKKVSELSPKELQVHHIFPREFLERRGVVERFDEFSNITIISKSANNEFKFKDPQQYLAELEHVDPELLEKHFIPIDKKFWKINSYEEFLKERVKLIAQAIQKQLNIKVLKE
jgi:hypothetical protein